MAALLEERSKRQNSIRGGEGEEHQKKKTGESGGRSLESLVESVKRKSAAAEQQGYGSGKRRKM